MPEGHTIHRLAARHRELFAGRALVAASPQGRFAAGAATLTGRTLRDTEAYGKHLLHHYAGDLILHVHLGLYGRFADGPMPFPEPVGQLRLRLNDDRHWLELRGPAACELFDPAQAEALRSRLGADPLRDDADPDPAYARIGRSPTPIAALLLDQSVIAGAGLIYVTEVLFRAGIPPTRPAREVTPRAWQELWTDLRALMKEGVARGRIDTVHTAHTPEAMGRAPRVDRHGGEVYVYRRAGQPCLVCGTEVRTAGLAGRNSYWCPGCQPVKGGVTRGRSSPRRPSARR
ncbi:Fpg/Nei family DNA glycosylase [Rhizomonospora bruguierae]|uniref:Fpg/Nei family DNA glycosylase n=1 Tax=Rhizomonospora bruguierae TaxID=1581705 RepID=UPI001BD17695|nr:DNA-formamidopyrimidine glycosylase family protein [Micromonospora sp. NBRC 107566]